MRVHAPTKTFDYHIAAITLIVIVIFGYYVCTPGVGILDWTKEIPYFQLIRESIVSDGVLPQIWWSTPAILLGYPAIEHSRIFVANPETFLLSPLVIAALAFPAHIAPKVISFILLLVGILGALRLSQRCQWNRYQRRCFFALFFLSPIVMQHLAIGFTPWANLFLFPWLMYFLLDDSRRSDITTGAIIALILLQGGSHPAVWFMTITILFFTLNALRNLSLFPLVRLATVMASTIALSCIRISLSAAAYQDLELPFVRGYGLAEFFFWATHLPIASGSESNKFIADVWNHIPSWDAGIYFGPILVPLVLLIVLYPLAHRRLANSSLVPVGRLICLILIFSYFSIDFNFVEWVKKLNSFGAIPFSQGIERYPYRFLIIAYFLSIVCLSQSIGTLAIDHWAKHYRVMYNMLEIAISLPLAIALFTWTEIGTSVDPNRYYQPLIGKQLQLEEIGTSNSAVISHQSEGNAASAVFEKTSPEPRRYLLKQIPSRDQRMMNLTLSNQANGRFKARLRPDRAHSHVMLSSSGSGRITLQFRWGEHLLSCALTALSWIALLLGVVLRCWSSSGLRKKT